MSALPAARTAFVEATKILGYLLDPEHPQNGGKAKFFFSFGFSVAAWRSMRWALKQHPIRNQVVAETTSKYGTKYTVCRHLTTPDGRNPCVTTVWIIEDDAPPRFVTAHP